jgi:hypothetical protein
MAQGQDGTTDSLARLTFGRLGLFSLPKSSKIANDSPGAANYKTADITLSRSTTPDGELEASMPHDA